MNIDRKLVVIGLIGVNLDRGARGNRWVRWRPSVDLARHEDMQIDRFELISQQRFTDLAETVTEDIHTSSPETTVQHHHVEFSDPWDFEEVYGGLLDFARAYPFDTDKEDYLIHITTGTHVAQICLFLLTESRHLPGRLIQTSPPRGKFDQRVGAYQIIDLDLSKYDSLATRFASEQTESLAFLKAGIETRNQRFNKLIERVERVAIRSREPMLLTGPTGAGKSSLARRIFELKHNRHQVTGDFVEVNCATLRGDAAMSTLFGHRKGAFTGAVSDRPGLLRAAHKGVVFLDEIGELGMDEQAMLLRALEEKKFLPVGADAEVKSDFQLLAGTNRDLREQVRKGAFREDLLARIDLWTFRLPGLAERREDIEPNLDYELERIARKGGGRVRMSREVRRAFLKFAHSTMASWSANFRDLNATVTRMATLADAGRITPALVEEEIARLQEAWKRPPATDSDKTLAETLDEERLAKIDPFDRPQLAQVIEVCRNSATLAEAGKKLFSVSRTKKANPNDSDRVRKYLTRFGVDWRELRQRREEPSAE